MGKKSKTGKARKDKFYHLAKETGFRARSAFKLLQLNRKYEFLQNSRVCIDLCAAPGGWLQVAAQNMPVSSIIIGIDLVPIKPVHNVKTFTEDITTDKCRVTLKKELHDWKADCVLNDGAPNVGKNWVQDAFTQAELTLSAMKLATCFLKKGGWFVTKVFRSKDYQSLMWVFSQLFKKVYATKPQASRNESAEIFVVCQGYLAPDKLDEKFTDPKFVFKEVLGGQKKLDILNLKKKPKAEGYADEDNVLHHKLSASKLVKSANHMELLVDVHEIVLDDDELANHELTTDELREYMKDVKVLGRREIRLILNWRKKMRAHFADLKKAAAGTGAEVVEAEEESEDEEAKTDEMIANMKEEEAKDARKKRKAVLKEKRKLRDKMDLKMVIPGDEGLQTDEMDLFNLKKIKKKHELEHVSTADLMEMDASGSEEEDEVETMPTKMAFDRHNDEYEPDPDGIYTDDEENEDEDDEVDDQMYEDDDGEDEIEEAADTEAPDNPLVVELRPKDVAARRKAALWFQKDAFSGVLDVEAEQGLELAAATTDYTRRGGVVLIGRKRSREDSAGEEQPESDEDESDDNESDDGDEDEEQHGKKARLFDEEHITDTDLKKKYDSGDSESGESDSDSEADDYFDAHSLVKSNKSQQRAVKNNSKRDGFEVVSATESARKVVKLSPVELAIGEEMVKSGKRRREIVDGSYNRYTFNDEELPFWFLKDEQRHCHKQLPVSKSQIEEQKERLRAINCRPIKKVAEAKARKKRKSVKKLEKVRKKAEAVSESQDTSDKEKWNQIRQIYSKAGLLKAKKVNVAYVVAKKGTGKKVRRPAGVQGRFRVVDPRMKKDDLARKKSEKANKGKKQKKRGAGGKKAGGGKR